MIRNPSREMPMTDRPTAGGAARRVLLATDLSARCDRALDRAAQLAGEWQAELIALNVLDPTMSPDQALAWARGVSDEALQATAQQQLARDLAASRAQADLRIVRDPDPAGAIRDLARSSGSDLVVTGVSRNPMLGRMLLGSTVEQLARSLPVPLLVVRNRPLGAYRNIVVATDFSASSRHALLAAAGSFPARELRLYHAHSPAMAGLSDAPLHADLRLDDEHRECADFIAASGLPPDVGLRTVIEAGPVESMLGTYVRRHDIDLVVAGSHGRGGVMSLLLGSTTARLLQWLPCDTMVVPEPLARR